MVGNRKLPEPKPGSESCQLTLHCHVPLEGIKSARIYPTLAGRAFLLAESIFVVRSADRRSTRSLIFFVSLAVSRSHDLP
jgi:hypothetical protein